MIIVVDSSGFLGPISEWVQALITLITAIIIYFSFLHESEDRKVEKLKNRIFIHNYIRTIRPYFTFLKIDCSPVVVDRMVVIHQAEFHFQLNENIAKNLQITVDFQDSENWTGVRYVDYIIPKVIGSSRFDVFAQYKGPVSTILWIDDQFSLDVHFHFHYSDIEGNRYKQSLACTLTNGDNSIGQRDPDLIEQVI